MKPFAKVYTDTYVHKEWWIRLDELREAVDCDDDECDGCRKTLEVSNRYKDLPCPLCGCEDGVFVLVETDPESGIRDECSCIECKGWFKALVFESVIFDAEPRSKYWIPEGGISVESNYLVHKFDERFPLLSKTDFWFWSNSEGSTGFVPVKEFLHFMANVRPGGDPKGFAMKALSKIGVNGSTMSLRQAEDAYMTALAMEVSNVA